MKRIVRPHCVMLFVGLAFAVLVASGCDSPTTESPAEPGEEVGTVESSGEEAVCTADDVQFVDKAGFDQFLAEQAGKVVFVDYWATWCGNCKEMFPHTVELQKKYGDDGLIVVAASVDEPNAANQQAVAEFLNSQGGDLEAFILTGGDELFDDFGIEIAVPHYQLFDQNGQLVKKFVFGDPTAASPKPEEIDEAIGTLITQGSVAGD